MKDSIYILDTNILLFDARALWNFPGQKLLVPIEVIGDLDNFKQEVSISDFELSRLGDMLDQLTAKWNGKWAALDCEQSIIEDELDTSGEEDSDYRDYNIL